ncbi:MAG: hypothetical protein CMD80_03850 [Gammaproteobacteria bacterium]|nr:hypothetical protein [Gammaproteobacteria bacterium]|tara:strand:- start:31 stop:333 length:303 start_codon:yes stop_codon:yes gene_type:complete
MINQNIENDKIKFTNLFKSFFSDLNNTQLIFDDEKVSIIEINEENSDPASVELEFKNEVFILDYWDGYSLAEQITFENYNEAKLFFKKFSKKMAKNLRRF